MQIINTQNHNSFKAARINIIANSDNHGNLNNIPDLYNAIKQNGDDIFQKSEADSTLNLYINVGDFFISPSKKGFLSYPNKTNGEIQAEFLDKFITKIKKVINKKCYELNEKAMGNISEINKKANFDAIYTPGNHCFDSGDKTFYELANKVNNMTVVMTNIDKNKSPYFNQFAKKNPNKFITSKKYEIPDDKNPDLKHHLMILGATIPSMDFYNPGLLKGTIFSDTNCIKDSKMEKDNLKGTISSIKTEVDTFKKEHPKGIIILSSHMGARLSKIIRDEVPDINEILDGHKHDIATIVKGNTVISSLGMDNNIVKAISLKLDDNGELDERESRVYCSDEYRLEKYEGSQNALSRLLTETYAKDYNPIIKIQDKENGETSLDYKPSIRYDNSYLANFLTSTIKDSIIKIDGQEDLAIVGIQSSTIRGGIKDGSNNFSILKIFDGVSEDLSDIKTGFVTGEELTGIILDNIKDNLKDPARNTILQWSDIKINKNGIKKVLEENPNANIDEIKRFISIRKQNNKFEEINYGQNYKIAFADKYLKNDSIKYPKLIRNKFSSINKTYNNLFLNYLQQNNYQINIEPKHKEKRIIFGIE